MVEVDTHIEERALVAGCVAGDPQMRNLLVTRYHRVVRQTASFAAQRFDAISSDTIEDATQSSFLVFFKKDAQALSAWNEQASLRTYLCRVTERVAMRHYKRTALQSGRFKLNLDAGPTPDHIAPIHQVASKLETVDVQLTKREERSRIRGLILERLSEKGREYYEYLFVQEMTVGEIVEFEGTNPNNVYQWKNRIARTAELVLEDEGYFESE